MSTVWRVPVATTEEQLLGMSRRLLREATPDPMPRDARPSRTRRERVPEALRVWGAASCIIR